MTAGPVGGTRGLLGRTVLHADKVGRGFNRAPSRRGLLAFTAAAVLFGGGGVAQSGPCTTQIVLLEHQIAGDMVGSNSGPTAPQTLSAQLHHQPTPGSVGTAEHVANADGDAAIERAKKADADGDAAGCSQALIEARRLYDISQ